MCRFIESIKVLDGNMHLYDLHQRRVNQTLKHFGSHAAVDLLVLNNELAHNEKGLFKLRIVYALNGEFTAEIIPYTPSKHTTFQLVQNNTLDYSFKRENRAGVLAMKNQSSADEIIITQNNCITDTSYSNLVFLKDNQWFTPKTYLLNGVMRQELLRSGKITAVNITTDNLAEFTHFQLINAMNSLENGIRYPISAIIN